MKQLISTIGDRLQAIFPPNRLMLVLAGPITAGSIWLSAWITANVPGVELPVGVIAGAMGVVGLIVVTLIYKWFDQWQAGEPLTFDKDLEQALAELEETTTAFLAEHGAMQQVGVALQGLHDGIAKGSVNEAEIAANVSEILDLISPQEVPAAPAEIQPPHPESAAPSSPPAAPAPAA